MTACSLNKVQYDVDRYGIAKVCLNTPEKHNAFDDDIIQRLTTLFDQISQDNNIRVMILASTGKSFSAGADLAWMKRMAGYNYQDNLTDANALALMLKTLNFMPQTTIAKVQGAAFGGAVGLASCCDIVIASDKASFCLSEVKLGLIPATISPYVLNAIGPKAARRYFQTAERFSADKAYQIGLVDEVVSAENLTQTVNDMVSLLMKNGPIATQEAKKLALDVAYQDINSELIGITSERIATIRVSNEGQEGLTAFFDKRLPSWCKEPSSQG
jgi:methylglutaconyl-CoA hydratase